MSIDLVGEIHACMYRGGTALFDVLPSMLKRAIKERVWEQRKDRNGQPFQSFEAFVQAPQWHGLESSVSDLLAYCRKSPEAQAAIRGAVGGLAAHGEIGKGHEDRANNIRSEIHGTDPTYTLRRLKRDRPDLAERVVSGELSAHAAAIEAGFRPKQLTVTARSRPETVAARLRETFGDEFVARLREVL